MDIDTDLQLKSSSKENQDIINSKNSANTTISQVIQENESSQKTSSPTANAILNILQQISISPPETPDILNNYPFISIISTNANSNCNNTKSSLQHLHSLPKSIIPKRRLSSSSSFDGYSANNSLSNINNNSDKSHKKQLIYLRGYNKIPTVRSIQSPLSRSFLINRLNTFSVFNWTITSNKLSPLFCATQGWKCHPVRKNELRCTSCHSGIIVKLTEIPDSDLTTKYNKKIFNNHHHADNYDQILNNTEKYELPFDFQYLDDDEDDENDDIHVYETLVNSYVNRLSTDHYPTCTFLPFLPLFPKDENYYISSKDIPREINKFLNRLEVLKINKIKLIGKNFKRQFLSFDEIEFLREYLRENINNDDDKIDIDVVDNFKDKEFNYNIDLSINPSLDVILPALLGWELKVQKFHNDKFLLLNCECCTRRILLSTVNTETIDKDDTNNNNNNNIEELKPCPHRAEIPAREQLTEFDETIGIRQHEFEEEDYEEDIIDLEQEHDNWCCMKSGWRIVLEGLRSSTEVDIRGHRDDLQHIPYLQSMEQLRKF
jgi:hypothetical protein